MARESSTKFQEMEKRLQDIRGMIEESLALILPEPLMTAGRLVIPGEQWNPTSGGVSFQRATMPRDACTRRVKIDAQHVSDLQEIGRHISKRELIKHHKGLALAMRRLSYQAQRERPEDELLDTTIAAEVLYLAEIGNEPYRGELRYRLALRAALWADGPGIGSTKREVLKLMQSAYDARSALAHGGTPDPKIIRIRGQRVELPELVKKTRAVVGSGCAVRWLRQLLRCRLATRLDALVFDAP
jgi:hypothetical protein